MKKTGISLKTDKIKLVYWFWKEPNFGDILSPFIISSLSGKRIIHKSCCKGTIDCIKQIVKCLLFFRFKEWPSILFPWEKNLIGVGSIIGLGNKHSSIWGSGFLLSKNGFNGGKVCAVRGKRTNEKLVSMGYEGTSTFGDPAMLVPLLIKPSAVKSTDVGIIPHYTETDYFIERYGGTYKIIDLRTKDIKKVISEITSCRCILSTSLHGIIVSHAYGIPALWIKLHTLNDDDFKFYDYFSSVGIDDYEGFKNIDEILASEQGYKSLFLKNEKRMLPNVDVHDIQRDLLLAAPFDVVNVNEDIKNLNK